MITFHYIADNYDDGNNYNYSSVYALVGGQDEFASAIKTYGLSIGSLLWKGDDAFFAVTRDDDIPDTYHFNSILTSVFKIENPAMPPILCLGKNGQKNTEEYNCNYCEHDPVENLIEYLEEMVFLDRENAEGLFYQLLGPIADDSDTEYEW